MKGSTSHAIHKSHWDRSCFTLISIQSPSLKGEHYELSFYPRRRRRVSDSRQEYRSTSFAYPRNPRQRSTDLWRQYSGGEATVLCRTKYPYLPQRYSFASRSATEDYHISPVVGGRRPDTHQGRNSSNLALAGS